MQVVFAIMLVKLLYKLFFILVCFLFFLWLSSFLLQADMVAMEMLGSSETGAIVDDIK